MKTQSILVLAMVVFSITGVSQALVIDWVTVGNPSNANDDTGYGGVSDVYQISKYEVTAGQYRDFLNAVATTDTYGLYNTDMWSDEYGCKIQQSGSSGSYTYSVAADYANRPVNYVSWYSSLRFSNWLHNGQPTGVQDVSTTEDGAYNMSLGLSVVREPDATVWLPSENEWYKTAYHKNDGVTGNYFDYPTSSDSAPSNDLVEPIDPGNNATFYIDVGDYTIGSPSYRTEVGAHENSDSPYDTFDMGGNVWEWNEALIGSYRGIRGGSCYDGDLNLRSFVRGYSDPYYEYSSVGFRVASIPKPAKYYVDADATGANNGSSWEDAFNYLQDALAVADPCDEIWVAEGIYRPDEDTDHPDGTGDREATFQLKNGVPIYGGYAGFGQPDPNERDPNTYQTILSGDLNGDDVDVNDPCDLLNEPTRAENSYQVVTGSDTNETAILDGFTITAGNANGSYPDDSGGGMYNNSGSPTVTNCKFTANSAAMGGGMMNWESSSPTVTNCDFSGNSADWDGGGMCNWINSSPMVSNCTFSGNLAADGGGICNFENSSPMVTNCTFIENSAPVEGGGGIHNSTNSPATITNCTFSGNSAIEGGGMWNYDSDPIVTNCTFSGNSASGSGGGMYNYNGSDPNIANCTFSQNTAMDGGGIFNSNSNPLVSNCTFIRNSAGLQGGGGGAFDVDGSNTIYTNCTFTKNFAPEGGGGMWIGNCDVTITNCIFSGNITGGGGNPRADVGAGILLVGEGDGEEINLNNCTFMGNKSGEDGGGICCIDFSSKPLDIANCVFWGNEAARGPEIASIPHWQETTDRVINIAYSNIQGGLEGLNINQNSTLNWGVGNINADPCFVDPCDGDYRLLPISPCIDAGDNNSVPADTTDLDGDGNTTEPIPFDLDGNPRIVDGNSDGNSVVDMGAYEAMVSCFGVNHVKLETKAGKKGSKVELKGTFSPALPINFAVDDVAYIIDDGQGNALVFLIPAGSFEVDGKPGKQKFRFDSPKHSQPDINARFDFLKCRFELNAKKVPNTDEITGTTLAIELWAGANVAQEVVEVKIKPRHLEYKREPKLSCCQKCKGIALLEVTSDQGVFVFEPEPGKEKLKRKTVVDDGVNGRVKIDTSCSKPIDVGDVFGVYTVTDLIKIFDDWPDDENDE